MEQQAAGFGVEQSGDEVGGRLAGGLANDAREVGGRNRQIACIKPDVVLLLVVGDEEPDELLEQLIQNISLLSEERRRALALIVADLLTAKQSLGNGDEKK